MYQNYFQHVSGKSVSLHIATAKTSQCKMWIYDDPGGKDWFNTDFKRIYATAYEALYREERKYYSNGDTCRCNALVRIIRYL